MKMHVVVNSRSEVIGTAPITPITAGKNEGIVGISPFADQTVYELDMPDSEVPKDPSELHEKCEQAVKSGAAKKLEQSL
jgi:hypothetical protein